jgi:hypothetical protein
MTLEQVTNLSGFGNVIGQMEICETEIERACKRAPMAKRPLLFGAFMTLCSQMNMPPEAYRAHCRELLQRVECGEDIQAPTVGEMITVLYEVSLMVPLKRVASALYFKLIQRGMPEMYMKLWREGKPGIVDGLEQYDTMFPGETDELEADTRQVLARKLKPRAAAYIRIPGGPRAQDMKKRGIRFPTEDEMPTIYTIGYKGVKAADLKAFAEREGATVLDIRLKPWSPRPEFQKASLARFLGDRYQHIGELGNVNYKNGGPVEFLDREAGEKKVRAALGSGSVILLCACEDVNECHRKPAAVMVEVMTGCQVVHLTKADVAQEAHVPKADQQPPVTAEDVQESVARLLEIETDTIVQPGLFADTPTVEHVAKRQLPLL